MKCREGRLYLKVSPAFYFCCFCFWETSRNTLEEDFEQVATFFHRGVEIAKTVKADTGGKMKAYRQVLADGGSKYPEIAQLKSDVVGFSRGFPAIGFDQSTMRYPA